MKWVLTIVLLALTILVWWALSEFVVSAPFLLPSPDTVLRSYQDTMLSGAFATTLRASIAFLTGVSAAYALFGFLHVLGVTAQSEDQFSAARAIPIVAATPLFIMWFGFGELARALVVTLSVVAFTIGPLAEATQNVPRELTLLRERLNRSRMWEFAQVVVPATLPAMIGPLRVAFAVAFTTAVAVDFMGSTVGIGRVIDSARVTFNVPAIFLMLIVSGLIGIVLDRTIRTLLRHVTHWRGRTIKG